MIHTRRTYNCTAFSLSNLDGREPHDIAAWPKAERDALLRHLREDERMSIRQIERITGISRGIVVRC